ncbi:MAG: bacterial transcriptional activator domain-containing protein [Coriobacteriales bacterium]|jgi:DNA-binding SARP family transcriptional activator|nr:bacterial transcriptional activator domain-containing protein [Coriobacteriales bacterium]
METALLAALLPNRVRGLAALLMIVGQGQLTELGELGFAIDETDLEELTELCPSIQVESLTGRFSTAESLPSELDESLISAVLALERSGERWDMSDRERCFERFSLLAVYLLDIGAAERSQQLLRLTSQLLPSRQAPPGRRALSGHQVSSNRQVSFSHQAPSNRQAPRENLLAQASNLLTALKPEPEAFRIKQSTVPLLRVRLFGDLEIESAGKPFIRSPLRKGLMRTLFCLLVLNQGKGLSRETVIDWLWPERDPDKALVGFYNLWHRLCMVLPTIDNDCPYLKNDERLLRIDPRFVESDVAEFERLARQVLFEQGSLEERFAAIDRLEQLYLNDVLAGSATHPRIKAAQDRYRGMLLDVLLCASELHLQASNNSMALWYARRAFEVDPDREDVYRLLMSTQEASGQRTAAINTFQDCRRFLDEQLGVLPSKQTAAIYQDLILDGQ